MARETTREKGTSLAKGPVAITGLALLAAGILGYILSHKLGHSFTTSNAVDGTANGDKALGFEGNGWTWALTAAAGLLLVLAAPLHWGAKSMAILVGLILGAASVIALYDKKDVFGLAAANGPTKLGWGAAAALLLVLGLLPRVGRKERVVEDRDVAYRERERRPIATEREVVRERPVARDRGEVVDRDVVRGERVGEVDRREGALRDDRDVEDRDVVRDDRLRDERDPLR